MRGNYDRRAPLASSQIITLERMLEESESRNEELQAELEKERSRPDYSYEAQEQLAELKAISLNGGLSWQDKHIAAFKILNPELLQEKGE